MSDRRKEAVHRHTRFSKDSARRCEKSIETKERRIGKAESAAIPDPKYKLGDLVNVMDGRKIVDTGEISLIVGYDPLGFWRYKVKTPTSRVAYNEASLKPVKTKAAVKRNPSRMLRDGIVIKTHADIRPVFIALADDYHEFDSMLEEIRFWTGKEYVKYEFETFCFYSCLFYEKGLTLTKARIHTAAKRLTMPKKKAINLAEIIDLETWKHNKPH